MLGARNSAVDFATCEAPPDGWGQNRPDHWASLAKYTVEWSGDVVLRAGTYTFGADIQSGESAQLQLNDHQVLSSAGPVTYKLEHQPYRLLARYTATPARTAHFLDAGG